MIRFSNFASSPSSFVSKGLMAEQTFVLSQVADSAPCIATRTIKVTLKQAANNKEKHKNNKEQSHDVPLMYLSTTPMHLPRLWTDAPVAKSRSRGEQNGKGSTGSTQGPQQTQPKKERK